MALAILGALSPDALTAAIVAQDRTALTQADGVGPKLATRIVIELRDKVGGLPAATSQQPGVPTALDGAAADAVSALVNLGYRRVDAFGAVARASRKIGTEAGLDALIRGGLKEMAP